MILGLIGVMMIFCAQTRTVQARHEVRDLMIFGFRVYDGKGRDFGRMGCGLCRRTIRVSLQQLAGLCSGWFLNISNTSLNRPLHRVRPTLSLETVSGVLRNYKHPDLRSEDSNRTTASIIGRLKGVWLGGGCRWGLERFIVVRWDANSI